MDDEETVRIEAVKDADLDAEGIFEDNDLDAEGVLNKVNLNAEGELDDEILLFGDASTFRMSDDLQSRDIWSECWQITYLFPKPCAHVTESCPTSQKYIDRGLNCSPHGGTIKILSLNRRASVRRKKSSWY